MWSKVRGAATLGVLQFLNWSISTLSWRATAQANIPVAVFVDTLLASFNFWLYREIAKSEEEDVIINWLFYTIGGVLGTVVGILTSKMLLGN